jgi:Uma2 family endonuclease
MALVLDSRRRFTFADVATWPDDGRRFELYDGEVSVVPAPLPRHQLAMLELQARLRDHVAAQGGLVLVSPIDSVLSERDVVQPDIVVFTANRRHLVRLDEAIRTRPDVAVEVLSPSTVTNDRGRKLRLYERFGVPEYWMLDPAEERMEVRCLMRETGRYGSPIVAVRGAMIGSAVLDGFTCPVDTLFPW